MRTLDLRKKFRELYKPSAKKVAVVNVPEFLFVMIDGKMEKGKSPGESPAFREGLCIQTMHIGPYKNEPATIERMEAFAAANGYALHGLHHEIYLSDPRRTAPERLKTVLRHPVKKKKNTGTTEDHR
jgi:hypothetical protein